MGIVFLTNYYLPKPLANGVCVQKLAECYAKKSIDTFVICFRRKGEKKTDYINGVHVIRISVPLYHELSFFANANTDRTIGTFAGKISIAIGRFKKLVHFNEYPLRDTIIVQRYINKATKLVRNGCIDTLVGVYTPYESVKAAAILKKKFSFLKTVYYSLDTLSNEGGLGILSSVRRSEIGKRQEALLFQHFDLIVLMNCHASHYNTEAFDDFKKKIVYADFPLLIPLSTKRGEIIPFSIVFTGSLYRTIRNPKDALKILECVLERYTLHFFGYSDCTDILRDYSEKYSGHVFNHGFVSYDEAVEALRHAEILLSIGNYSTTMVPSKIYEYISTGKPIIHIYSDDNDPCIEILHKYGNAICISLRSFDKNKLHRFLVNRESTDLSIVKNTFMEATPEYFYMLLEENKTDDSFV